MIDGNPRKTTPAERENGFGELFTLDTVIRILIVLVIVLAWFFIA